MINKIGDNSVMSIQNLISSAFINSLEWEWKRCNCAQVTQQASKKKEQPTSGFEPEPSTLLVLRSNQLSYAGTPEFQSTANYLCIVVHFPHHLNDITRQYFKIDVFSRRISVKNIVL
ncbi:Hypothetical_protein [Hexamita inflata]|uniref:Hypothetical_protein n=1 Tax=Hexamita inflata TaxID=28002 RepID=A0AA86RIY2_9EUKA|nr:Hypothetical protein HINF_LOCUS55405 [Hexamita inflata]